MPTTDAQFSVREILKFATSKNEVANFKIHSPLFPRKIFPFGPRIDSPQNHFQKIISGKKMNPVSQRSLQSPSEIESSGVASSTVSSVASSWSEAERSEAEDETPTTSDEEFIVSDSEMEEAEQAESEEDDIELLYESFINLREENKLIKQELAKQNNLLWEIYEELKESKPKAPAK